ncbi:MAG: HAMP domain-containing histidine kinase [Clostridium sp.]|uniref:sensor histidine kinase n=1 Tax=Clostridium sp. TaxID=1506 RepID=UPI002A8ED9B6|nr:HAMP domain-containing histidine kinase [Clostridium sp.]MDY5098918.1 HAMP domain-containing sensor histidine kinase [Clostridium sp.]
MNLNYSELPKDAEYVIEEAFQGKTSFSKSFSDILNTKSITVGTPIKNYDDSVIVVVLLHSPVEDISSSIHGGFKILIVSIALALIIAIIISMFMSLSFTKPLSKMKDTAILLSKGNYKVKTEVHQCDGIITKPDKVSEYHNHMLHESIHLQRLVNDLLDLSKLQNVDFKIEIDNLDLSLITEEVIHSMNRIASNRNIKIISNLSLSHCAIVGDYSRIRQMLMIVLDNAIKFSKEYSLITVNLIKNENYIKLSIVDNGCGISKENLPHIFDRFHKSNSNENKNGTGLGLAIANQIANRHNITIDVTSEPYIETCFTFKFPLT